MKTIALIGCGRVGTAIALGLKRAGYRIVSVCDINPAAERRAARLLVSAAGPGRGTLKRESPDVILIGTPDSQIASVGRTLARSLKPGQIVVHFSGALSSRLLGEQQYKVQSRGPIGRLAMHPVLSFPTFSARQLRMGTSLGGVSRCWFSLEGNQLGLAVGRQLVRALGGKAVVIRARDKPLFHAACVFVSNFLDVIVDSGLEACATIGLRPKTAYRVLEPLILETLGNIARVGSVKALSGPVERGDTETVRQHLAALASRQPALAGLYRDLSRQALAIALRKGSISKTRARALARLL